MRAVYYTPSVSEAELVRGFLLSRGIDAVVEESDPGIYGWAIESLTTKILVPEEDAERAEALIAGHRPSEEE